jgi:hypothetical protein
MVVNGSLKPPTSRAKRKTFVIRAGALALNCCLNSHTTGAKAPAICVQKPAYYIFPVALAVKLRNAEVRLWALKTLKTINAMTISSVSPQFLSPK